MAFELKPGDAVTHEGTDYLVVLQRGCRDAGFAWQEWLLAEATGPERLWVVALEDSGDSVGLFEECALGEAALGAEDTTLDGGRFSLWKSGRANMAAVDENGRSTYDRWDYWHYRSDSGDQLIVLRTRTGVEAKRGHAIDLHDLKVYPL